jgi:hypothetical protein
MEAQGVPVRLGGVYRKKMMQTKGVQVSAMIISLSSSPTPAADFLSLADLDLCLAPERAARRAERAPSRLFQCADALDLASFARSGDSLTSRSAGGPG